MRSCAAAFALGCAWLQRESRLPDFHPLVLAAVALAAAVCVRSRPARLLVLIVAAAGLGYGYAAWRAEVRLADALPAAAEGQDLRVTGIVASLPQVDGRGVRFVLHVEEGAAVPEWISLTWYADREGPPPKIVAGQRWSLVVRLRRPRGLANPHGFDFEAWALERGIRASGYVRRESAREPLAHHVAGWPQDLHRWRGEVRENIDATLAGERLRGVIVALAIGDQDAIAAEDWNTFWATGVGHLVSISGLHITMLAALAAGCAGWLWLRLPGAALRVPARRVAVAVGLAAAFAYTLMTGYAVPAQRTFIMLAVVASCVLLRRHGSASRVLALAALVVLLVDPWAVLAVGFWLSFGAVAAIFMAMGARTGAPGRVRAALLEQWSVTLAMAPIMLALFQQVSLVAPLANAIAIPVVSLIVVPLAIAGGFLAVPFLLWAGHEILLHLMTPLEALAALDWATYETAEPSLPVLVAAIFGCAWVLAPRGVPMRSCGVFWIAPLFVIPAPQPAFGAAWIDVLDVGQGLAIVVRTASHALLFDAGPSWYETDSGERIVVPYLRGEGIRALDGLVVSHRDDDHAGGAASVVLARSPAWMLSPLAEGDLLRQSVEPSLRCLAGQRWQWDGVEFRVLHPGPEAYDPGRRVKENDRGCVIHVESSGGAALLAADIEARAEQRLVQRERTTLRSDVLLVPHHGSRTSSTVELLSAVAPSIAVASLGYRNRFNHPNAAVVTRYAAAGIVFRRTDLEGAMRIVLPGPGQGIAEVEALVPRIPYWSDRGKVP